jgi:hypothetical protein
MGDQSHVKRGHHWQEKLWRPNICTMRVHETDSTRWKWRLRMACLYKRSVCRLWVICTCVVKRLLDCKNKLKPIRYENFPFLLSSDMFSLCSTIQIWIHTAGRTLRSVSLRSYLSYVPACVHLIIGTPRNLGFDCLRLIAFWRAALCFVMVERSCDRLSLYSGNSTVGQHNCIISEVNQSRKRPTDVIGDLAVRNEKDEECCKHFFPQFQKPRPGHCRISLHTPPSYPNSYATVSRRHIPKRVNRPKRSK